jgi:carboxymethylenebutenolidase
VLIASGYLTLRCCSSLGMHTLIALLVGVAILPSFMANAQNPAGADAIFRSDNKPVTMERFDPKAKGLHLAVMLVHGGGGPDGDWRKGGIIEALTAAGYSVFVPHYFDGGGQWTQSDNPHQFIAYIRTLNDAGRYIAQQPEIDSGGIGLVGFSLGGYLVLGLAEEVKSHPPPLPSPAIKAVVEMYGGMPDFAVDRMTTMPPVLILHGEDDAVVTVARAHDLEKLLDKKTIPYESKIYPHQGHGFSDDALIDANKRTVSFLTAHLH